MVHELVQTTAMATTSTSTGQATRARCDTPSISRKLSHMMSELGTVIVIIAYPVTRHISQTSEDTELQYLKKPQLEARVGSPLNTLCSTPSPSEPSSDQN